MLSEGVFMLIELTQNIWREIPTILAEYFLARDAVSAVVSGERIPCRAALQEPQARVEQKRNLVLRTQ